MNTVILIPDDLGCLVLMTKTASMPTLAMNTGPHRFRFGLIPICVIIFCYLIGILSTHPRILVS
jgi:hypothetical protein